MADSSQDRRLTISRAATHETERKDNGFCLSRSHYTENEPNSRERVARAAIDPRTTPPPPPPPFYQELRALPTTLRTVNKIKHTNTLANKWIVLTVVSYLLEEIAIDVKIRVDVAQDSNSLLGPVPDYLIQSCID